MGISVNLESGIVALLQVAIGANIGRRFKGTKLKEIKPLLLFAFLPTLILMCFIILFALLLSYFSGQTFITALLAVAPGGIGEMGLLAILVGADQAFVTVHQLTRLIIVSTFLKWSFWQNGGLHVSYFHAVSYYFFTLKEFLYVSQKLFYFPFSVDFATKKKIIIYIYIYIYI